MSGLRIATILLGVALPTFAIRAADPIPPTIVKVNRPKGTLGEVLKDFTAQTGIVVDASTLEPTTPCDLDLNGTPLWNALELIAEKAKARIVIEQNGRGISLVKQTGPKAISSVDGAFRVVVKQVNKKLDFESWKVVTDVTLDIHWEPRIPVFRIESQPTISTVTTDAGDPKATTSRAKTPPGGKTYTTTVRLEGIPKPANAITELSGQFLVTAAPRMLRFDFPDLMNPKALALPEQSGVKATLKPVQKFDGYWEFPVEVNYPALPEFESFESWVSENRWQLIDPNGRTHEPVDFDIPEQGLRLSTVYRFPAEPAKNGVPAVRKGWSAVYYTPAPLVEFSVKFRLKDIPLP